MNGYHVLHLWCACGHEGEVRNRPEWNPLVRDQLLPKFKCSVCGGRPNDMRIVWHIVSDRLLG